MQTTLATYRRGQTATVTLECCPHRRSPAPPGVHRAAARASSLSEDRRASRLWVSVILTDRKYLATVCYKNLGRDQGGILAMSGSGVQVGYMNAQHQRVVGVREDAG